MKKLSVKKGIECQACLACVNVCSATYYKEENPFKSCIQIVMGKDGSPKPNVCVQCGKCAKACEHEAIKQLPNGVYTVDRKKCVKCGKCVEACPFGVMVLDEQAAAASKCIACAKCVKACPMELLEIVEK